MKKLLIIFCIVIGWWIVRTECVNHMVYNVWTNGQGQYWLPALDNDGNVRYCR